MPTLSCYARSSVADILATAREMPDMRFQRPIAILPILVTLPRPEKPKTALAISKRICGAFWGRTGVAAERDYAGTLFLHIA